ncbi:MAG: 16S rRNA (adenine(1518)-N(6)/adenine(1519)-N(6))-dimethyltransferase RsmA [Lachnospiraceae bacterium]|nr:16S rRNA (adenine(1518)-N(6)/adenine(1519)-N(6))-dimethyltransferase RsmA [Lachnospiraceae bacterium]
MEDIKSSVRTAAIINKYGFDFKKRFGQNFLIDDRVLDKIIDASGITGEDTVLEIGPGIGTLTERLLQKAKSVIAVEIDRDLVAILQETLADYKNLVLINNDILKVDIRELAEKYNGGNSIKVIANLPYYITTPIIMGIYESGAPVRDITVMVQKEVARRMQAGPGSKDYGALSLAVAYYAKPYIAASVPRNCFMPRPNVDSAVIRLTSFDEPPVKVKDEKLMFRIIRAVFNQRRKTMVNSLSGAQELSLSKEEARRAVTAAGLPEDIRGEKLTLEEFARTADLIGGYK